MSYYIGVDVGTGSARAALVDEQGAVVAESAYNTTSFRDAKDANIFEQSTEEIWGCISKACQDVIGISKVPNTAVKGIGFDATCSLVVCKLEDGTPVAVNPSAWTGNHNPEGEPVHNIILWADHRAYKEARDINATRNMVLKFVGGTVSLEMELPKILWLKRHMPAELFEQCMFFDLPDFLTYRATGDLARSNCSLACKCSYVPPGVEDSKGWNDQLFRAIGLDDFIESEFKQIGGIPGKSGLILTAGQPVGQGLSANAAAELGLLEGIAVGSGVIDAYAGWVGTIAAPMEGQKDASLDDSKHRLAAIAGTSTVGQAGRFPTLETHCLIVQSPEAVFAPGVWGPYKHAIFPEYWMNEGGQSSTGQLLDFMIDTHPASDKLKALAKERGMNHFSLLTELLETMAKDQGMPFLSALTQNVQLYPDLHGNRSPLADNDMRGMFIGMALDKNISDLALRYYATGEAIALQTRQIIDEMNKHGHEIRSIFMSGGLVKNQFLMSLIANVCNVPVQLPHSHSASVVIGSAMLGAAAAAEAKKAGSVITTQEEAKKGSYGMKDRLWDIMVRMSKPGTTVNPSASDQELRLLKVKYKIFKECIVLQRKWRAATAEAMALD
ncbi:BQ2448_3399 [Microbotryum intermedium]|uniref:BQ2448_3399 protein n=1 Tax=Microbotryum intermedium TaxID=269621 RepID=A0A238FBU1_9BASI|nr:BQ2448_3399 [Microbotryum intermedium]